MTTGAPTKLTVWIGDWLAGHLQHHAPTNRFAFGYASAWRDMPDAFPLSPQLPLMPPPGQPPDLHSAIVRQFFENLLPEGDALDHAARAHGIAKSNLLGLMHALGRETAGAIRLTASDVIADEPEQLRVITPEELSHRIKQRAALPFSVWDHKVRLSIAGYQDKIAVYEQAGELYLIDAGPKASTVIVKPAPVRPGLAGLPGNEFLCMQLALESGIPVAETRLAHVPEPVLFIRRFDRQEAGAGVRRLHLIDGCQLLGLSAAMKYERPYGDHPDVANVRDGANLKALFNAINAHGLRPAADRLALLRWACFQVLIGNTDAHGKNLSFFVHPSGVSLAPAYDLVCIPALKDIDLSGTLAMAIGDAFTDATITPFDWAQLGHQAGLRPTAMAGQMRRLILRLEAALATVRQRTQAAGVDAEMIDNITRHITATCERHLKASAIVKDVDPSLL